MAWSITTNPALQAPVTLSNPAGVIGVSGAVANVQGQVAPTPGTGVLNLVASAVRLALGIPVPGVALTAVGQSATVVSGLVTPINPGVSALNLSSSPPSVTATTSGVPDVGLNANLRGYNPFAGGQWYIDVTNAPVDPNSATYISSDIAAGGFPMMRAEMGGGAEGGGIPYYVTDSTQPSQFPLVAVIPTNYANFGGDICFAPFPINAFRSDANQVVEQYPSEPTYPTGISADDQHAIVFDRATHISYECFKGWQSSGFWTAQTYCVFDCDGSDTQRPYGNPSADVAGLSVFMGVGKGYQIVSNTINSAMRCTCDTVNNCSLFFSPPAQNAQNGGATNQVPFGARLRLKANVTIANPTSPYTPAIVAAWKKYGLINSDGSIIFSAIGDSYINNTGSGWDHSQAAFNDLEALVAADWDVVNPGGQTLFNEGGSFPTGTAPTVSLAVSSGAITTGQSVTVTPTFNHASIGLMCPCGGVRNSGTGFSWSPTQDTWFSLMANNAFGQTKPVYQRTVVTDWVHTYPTPNIFISPTGVTTNTGLSAASPWPISVLGNSAFSYILRGAIIQLAAGTYNASGMNLSAFYGLPSWPTRIQANGSVTINGGAAAIFTGGFAGLANIQFIGIKFTTTAAYCCDFSGNNDTGIAFYSCSFGGFGSAGVRLNGNSWFYSTFWNCSTTSAGFICEITNNTNALATQSSGSTFSGAYATFAFHSLSGNSGTVVN